MVVTMTKIVFSGDVPQKKPSLWKRMVSRVVNNAKELEKVTEYVNLVPKEEIKTDVKEMEMKELTNDIKDELKREVSGVQRITTKIEVLSSTLKSLSKGKKETAKYIKDELKNQQLVLNAHKKNVIVLEAILAEQ